MFQRAILVKEKGDRVASQLAEPMSKMFLKWTGVRTTPRPAEITLSLRLDVGKVKVEAFDSNMQKRWGQVAPNAPLSREQLQALKKAVGPVQRHLGSGSACVRIEGSPEADFNLLAQLLKTFGSEECADYDIALLYRAPLASLAK